MRAYIYWVRESEDGQAAYIYRQPSDESEGDEPVLALYLDGEISHPGEHEWLEANLYAGTGRFSAALREAEELLGGAPNGLEVFAKSQRKVAAETPAV